MNYFDITQFHIYKYNVLLGMLTFIVPGILLILFRKPMISAGYKSRYGILRKYKDIKKMQKHGEIIFITLGTLYMLVGLLNILNYIALMFPGSFIHKIFKQ